MAGGDDDDFLALLDDHLDPPHDPNLAMSNVQIVWIEDDPRLGALHIAQHGIAKQEVEQVLFEIPPIVEAKRSREHPSGRGSGERLAGTAGSSLPVKTGPRVRSAT